MSIDYSFWRKIKRSRIDYLILTTAFLLIAANQVFETTSLGASGTIEITEGSAISQDANYTITSSNLPSVLSAILLNESIEENEISFDILIQNVSRILCNVTLKSVVVNTTSHLSFYIPGYHEVINVSTGILPTTYSFEPNVEDIQYDESSIRTCYIGTTDERISLYEIVMWAEFEVPVSPVVIDWQTTDGQALFDNKYIREMEDPKPVIGMKSSGKNYYNDFTPTFQNRTLYMVPHTYTFRPLWYYHGTDSFNITVEENTTSTCLIYTRAVRLYLSVEPVLPLIRLTVSANSIFYDNNAYQLLLKGTEIPEYLYVPLFPSYYIEVTTIKLLSFSLGRYPDVVASGSVQSNGTNDLRINTIMPYMNILSLQITPHDFVQISLSMLLFSLVIVRIFLYLHYKKPRASWKDPRLIPILLIGVTVFIPWFSALRDYFPYDDIPVNVHVLNLGVIPLVFSWTDSSGIFLALPPNGLIWAIVSLIFFWIPLLYANYATTPPSIVEDNFAASLLLFSPLILLGIVQYGLNDLYTFQFTPGIIIQIIQIWVPLLFFCSLGLLWWARKFEFGHHENQLTLDVNLAEQLSQKKDLLGSTDSPRAVVEIEPPPSPNEIDVEKTLDLVLVIILFLFLLIPTSIGFYYERSWETGAYALDQIFYGSPISSIVLFLNATLGIPSSSIFWVMITPFYFLLSFDLIGRFRMKSRPALSITLFLLWVSVPFILLFSYSATFYINVGLEWILISLPYFLLTYAAVTKVGMYVKDEIRLRSLIVWIIIPVVFLIPGGMLLNWIASYRFAWTPLPIATIFLIVIIWPLRYWYQYTKQNLDVDREMDEMLHSDNMTENLG